ncbi:hypothetical protein [Pleomorphomonas carboxyditropha]|uniref:Uncharacterized protein n=1 Tax=Pleomorphomonas carboxyditropha TaxID=2023338 RepID=A0A2G9WPC4_9HYPH|nr:hypothetical protein [Pleomorphomonas carboxyditropha]PIO96556.1 hypothetical protein CJ014_24630 [Pleomorphomonas carboxyditropha]
MLKARQTAVDRYRARKRTEGLARVELQVPSDDVALLRRIAKALADPATSAESRRALAERFGEQAVPDAKELLLHAPFGDLEFDRPRDFGRPIDL